MAEAKKAEKRSFSLCQNCRHQKALLKGTPCSHCHSGKLFRSLTSHQKGIVERAEEVERWRRAKKKQLQPEDEFKAEPGIHEAVVNKS